MDTPIELTLPSLEGVFAQTSSLSITDSEAKALQDWLEEIQVARSPNTYRSYRREVERFVLWLLRAANTSLSKVTRQLTVEYQAFLDSPPAAWVNPTKMPRSHPEWRPLSAGLKPSSIKQAFVILHNFYDWLCFNERCGITANPFRRFKVKNENTQEFQERMLPESAVELLFETVEAMPRETVRQFMHYYRSRWLLTLLLSAGLRREEIATSTFGDLRYEEDHQVWMLSVRGKGKKKRLVTMTDELMTELHLYIRNVLDLAAPPPPTDRTPLVFKLNGKGWRSPLPASDKHLYAIVRTLCSMAAARAKTSNRHHLVQILEAASPHWFRHTSITRKLEAGFPIEDVAEDAGHANINTTKRYAHKSHGERAKRFVSLKIRQKP